MEKNRLVIVLVLSLGIAFGWMYLVTFLRKQHPEWFEQPAQPAATQTTQQGEGAAATATTTQQSTTQPSSGVATLPPGGVRIVGASAADARPAALGNAAFDPRGKFDYPVALNIDPRGASLASVTLNRFRRYVGKDEAYVFQQPYENVAADQSHALATRHIVLNGKQYDLANQYWIRQGSAAATQPSSSETTATYTIELRDSGGQPAFAIDKQYQLLPRSHESLGYEVVVTCTLRNLTNEPARVELVFNGPNLPAPENYRDVPEVIVGHNDERQVALEHQPALNFTPEKGAQSIKHGTYPLLWAGVLNAYFDAIVGPATRDGKSPLADVQASASLKRTDAGRDFTVLTMRTSEFTVPPGQPLAVPMNVYFGPRWRAVLNTTYYSDFPKDYDETLVLTSGPCAYCTFQWLINLLVSLLSFFYMIVRDWGLAIILLVIVVRLLLHPVTKRSQIAMSRMAKMGPEIERLKKKHGDNKEELNKAMMAVYREQGITPILGCLPMLLQMPIWIALWSALQSTFELRQAPFLWGYTWIDDLSQPDRLIPFSRAISFWYLYIDAINLLPIILGIVFYVQMKMQPKPANMSPEQEQQQRIMQWMSLLFPLLLYNGPSGLNLYIATSTAIGIWESKRVRDHIKAQEEAEKRGVVVSDKPDDKDRGGRGPSAHPRGPKKPDAPKGGLSGWLANLQQKAEEIQREVEKKRRDNR